MVIAGVLMRLALRDADERYRSDLGALLVSSCQAALALGDRQLLQDTLDELAPRLGELTSAEALDSAGTRVAGWHRPSPGAPNTETFDAFPVLGADTRRVGVLRISVSSERARAAQDRLSWLLGGIALVSLAVAWAASAALGKEIDEKGRLEGEFAAAERIQTSLLPREAALPGAQIAARMCPADEVGGDYYDIIRCEGGGWVCIGDAVGHGLPAGLTMLMLQSGIGTLLRHSARVSPREVVQAMNRLLYENAQCRLGEPNYATLLAVRYAENGAVQLAGGHLDPILWRRASQCCEFVSTEGPFVGLERELENSAIPQLEVQLEIGDLLLLYTDGITEAKSQAREMFGPQRLLQALQASAALPLEALIENILAACRQFSQKPQDDITLVALRRSADPERTV
jgi:serine phosphatase RsbU (regulator of sigma subunit)